VSAEDRRAILRDLLDAKEEEEEEKEEKEEEAKGKGKAKPMEGKGKEPKEGKGKEPMAPKRQGLKVAEARKRAAAQKVVEHGRLKVGDHALIMATRDHDVEGEESRWEGGTPDVPTSWYKEDLTPEPHTPLLCGVVVETVPKKPAWHFGHQVGGGLPSDQLCVKVRYKHGPT